MDKEQGNTHRGLVVATLAVESSLGQIGNTEKTATVTHVDSAEKEDENESVGRRGRVEEPKWSTCSNRFGRRDALSRTGPIRG